MLVVLVIAGLAVVACVMMVSLGHGGEMAEFPPDAPPLDLPEGSRLAAADILGLELPVGLVGYNTHLVDQTLQRVALALDERDSRIAVLEQRVTELLAARVQARQEAFARPAEPPRTDHEPDVPPAATSAWEAGRADAEESW
ncbi:hypothetical protein JOL79_28145 [Microbispora sp. RL4-1S]|uniref:DivIVA domain-containing protein n=1 Tax=Microbispora oryzae TaxID=2806554 RepID=A0A940WL51_9ACTN|nr:hypothetical protein [Microbispora oryzae]MBP2707660.1 hypothetical protein [Microbispora oryzae]